MAPDDRAEALEPRELTDPRTLRAITHPVRLALIELLTIEGPQTATQAGELIGQAPNTCSFHFRQLAKYGFVEEAGGGPGRNRPWRLTSFGIRFSDVHEDSATALAAHGLERMLRERYFARIQAASEARSRYPLAWREATGSSEFILHATPEELREVDREVTAVLQRYRERITDATLRPSDSRPVEVLLFAFLATHPDVSDIRRD